jgi:hypothetical protein
MHLDEVFEVGTSGQPTPVQAIREHFAVPGS